MSKTIDPKPSLNLGGGLGLARVASEATALVTTLVERHNLERPKSETEATRPPASDTNAKGDAWRAFDVADAADALADLYTSTPTDAVKALAEPTIAALDAVLATLRQRETLR